MKLKSAGLLLLLSVISCKQDPQNIVTTTPPVANPYPSGGVSLLPEPGLTNPRFHFHDGTVENNAPKIMKEIPDMPEYPASPWFVTQWKKTEILTPKMLVTYPESVVDPVLGRPVYDFSAQNGLSRLSVFKDPKTDGFIYELFGRGGWLDTGGGSNLFLSSSLVDNKTYSLDSRIDFNFRAKISKRNTEYLVNGAQSDGSVVSQFFSGFTLTYQDPTTKEYVPLFVQIAHADSRNPRRLPPGKLEYLGCYRNDLDQKQIVYGNNMANSLGGNGFLDAENPNGDLESFSYNLNNQICRLVTQTFKCQDGSSYKMPDAAYDLSNWRVGGFYMGIETQAAFAQDFNVTPTMAGPKRGEAALGVQIADLKLMKYPAEVSSLCPGATVTSPTTPITYCQEGSYLQNGACLKVLENGSVTSGKFCNGTNTVIWQCGQTEMPGANWVAAGNSCYHYGTQLSCK